MVEKEWYAPANGKSPGEIQCQIGASSSIRRPTSLPDESSPLASLVQEELIDGLSENLGQLLIFYPPVSRLRLLAFLHLVEQPETMKATLEVQPSGFLRLTLGTSIAPCKFHQH
jgi:hypothetical protein